MIEPTHIQTGQTKEGGKIKVTTGCGVTFAAKSSADALEHTTGWSCFVECTPCRERIGLAPLPVTVGA